MEQKTEASQAVDAPMPSGVEKMTKQELWNWFSRSQCAAAEKKYLEEKFFTVTTGLHSARLCGNPYEIIEIQRKRMAGLEMQMAQMQKGYERKLEKALKAQPAHDHQELTTTGVDSQITMDLNIKAQPAPNEAQDDGLSPVYAWLERSTRNSPAEVANAARTMMAFYQGAEFPEAAQGEDSARPSQQYQRITAPGQVKVGDQLRFTIGDDTHLVTAKLLLHAGTDKEEIIYNKRKNYYLITSMAIANRGGQKNCEFRARASAETGGVKS